jgi:Rod binding domain-containing protein
MSAVPIGTAGPAAPTPDAARVDPKVKQAAEGIEGVFMSMLLDEMLKSTGVGAEGASGDVYGGLISQSLGDRLAQTGGIGLASMLERQMATRGDG